MKEIPLANIRENALETEAAPKNNAMRYWSQWTVSNWEVKTEVGMTLHVCNTH